MTVRELKIGDVFRVAGEAELWRKASQSLVRPPGKPWAYATDLSAFTGKEIEVVERADTAAIRRSENTLILRDGEVTLDFQAAWLVLSCTSGERFTEFVLSGSSFGSSRASKPTESTALGFKIGAGAAHLNRPRGSEIVAYQGRVYGRATYMEVLGRKGQGGYQRQRVVDGAKRLMFAAVLGIPDEYALYDIIMEHFGPDAA